MFIGKCGAECIVFRVFRQPITEEAKLIIRQFLVIRFLSEASGHDCDDVSADDLVQVFQPV